MVSSFKMVRWQHSSICSQEAGHVEIRCFNQYNEPDEIFLQASVLVTEYLVAPYEL